MDFKLLKRPQIYIQLYGKKPYDWKTNLNPQSIKS